MKVYFTFAFFLITTFSFSQVDLEWSIDFGGGSFDDSRSIAMDNNNNLIVVGTFRDTVDFDPGPGSNIRISNGMRDIYVLKADPLGNVLWVKTYGGIGFDEANNVAIDASGSIYITGEFDNTVDFDPGPGIHNETQTTNVFFVQKLQLAVTRMDRLAQGMISLLIQQMTFISLEHFTEQ